MMKKIAFLFLGLFFAHLCVAIELSLPAIFADQMVLQRNQKVPVWGIATVGATVVLEFTDQKKSAIADNNGKWLINLDPLQASSVSRNMTIQAKLNTESTELKISDVLVGEVWLASGQSNMYRCFRMLIGKAEDPHYESTAEYLRNEAATANDPLFRQYKVGREQSVFEVKTEGRGNWSKAISGEVNEFSGTAYFFGRELRKELNVPVAIISCNLGSTKIEPWMPIVSYNKTEKLKAFYEQEIKTYKEQVAAWDDKKENEKYEQEVSAWKAKQTVGSSSESDKPRKAESPSADRQTPATLFNGMVNPIIPYAIKGAIWYQGESNTSNSPEEYGNRLSALVDSWREAWKQDKLYFYCCQLANYKKPNAEPVAEEDGWAVLSNAQRQILQLPNTGLAVLNDIGEADDIHPKNKIDTGKRLSLWALNQAYGKKNVCSGPLYKSSKIKGNKVRISFDYSGSGLMVGKKNLMEPTVQVNEPLRRFQICGADKVWKWAEAKIIAKNKVEVWHKDIKHPVEVRYAWSSNPEGANLYNKEGLPASIFKTEK